MSVLFGFLLFLLAAVYAIVTGQSVAKVKALQKNCLRHVDEDAEF